MTEYVQMQVYYRRQTFKKCSRGSNVFCFEAGDILSVSQRGFGGDSWAFLTFGSIQLLWGSFGSPCNNGGSGGGGQCERVLGKKAVYVSPTTQDSNSLNIESYLNTLNDSIFLHN